MSAELVAEMRERCFPDERAAQSWPSTVRGYHPNHATSVILCEVCACFADYHRRDEHVLYHVQLEQLAGVDGRACRTDWGGRRYDAPCDDCGHALIAHRVTDRVCSVCRVTL